MLEATLQALCQGTGQRPADVQAWLGPCIGPQRFEVGAEVLAAFGASAGAGERCGFRPRPRADGSPRWLADLPGLAQRRLVAAGVSAITVAGACTVQDLSLIHI